MSQDPAAFPLPFVTRDHLRFEGAAAFDLEVLTASKLADTVEITGMTRSGAFKLNLITDGATAVQTSIFGMDDLPIWLTLKTAGVSASVNNIYAMVYLRANKTRVQLLCQGYLGQLGGINFPAQVPPTVLQLQGVIGRVAVAAVGAGVEFTTTIPAGEYWRIHQVYGTLTTDATAVTRRPVLNLRDPGATTTKIPSAADHAASLAYKYHWFKGAVSIDDQTGRFQSMPFPQELILGPAYIISSTTLNLQAADQWSGVSIYRSVFYSA